MTTTGTPTEPRYAWGRRGRHRRPRPRKLLLAVGGLALAAGTLSAVRLLPGPGGDVGGLGAEAEPRVEGGGRHAAPDRATGPATAATVGEPPGAGPSATSAMGGLSGSPGPGRIPGLVPGPSASGPAVPLPAATTVRTPGVPDTRRPGEGDREGRREPGEHTGDRAPARGTPTPQPSRSDRPAPPPDRGTPPTSDPEPEPEDPGLCVPVIGLCVDLLRG
ncbi:hypothetical protein C4J65_21725 [Streptomyces sp. CB09001]|uniref:hypothetical protein n=1 Tax=unclassified Streptomyces TaxID=2593676 RepID=UPI000E218CD4|nr:hypothetical protein [Streptomyces sp. CB09001]AXL90618.1 hypothetical protein C4J65_21725 [Streptomyces sp. CB09001]